MKNFNLFLAFLVCSTVAMASTETPVSGTSTVEVAAPASTETSAPQAPKVEVKTSLLDTVKSYANTAYNYTLGYVDAADAVVVDKANGYVVTPVVKFVQPVTDKIASFATMAKDFTCNAVQYPFVHPLKTTVSAAMVYAMYYAYTQYNDAATKTAKN